MQFKAKLKEKKAKTKKPTVLRKSKKSKQAAIAKSKTEAPVTQALALTISTVDALQEPAARQLAPSWACAGTPDFANLQLRGTLGQGSFGCVRLAADRVSHIGYALKCLPKSAEEGAYTVEDAMLLAACEKRCCAYTRERRILSRLRAQQHPFVNSLVESYQDHSTCYLLLPLVQGVELHAFIQRGEQPLAPKQALFYVGCVILALEFLHARAIAYRDLKSENILVDALSGYPVLIDFGFAIELDLTAPHSRTMCGTPQSMAPELILGRPHGFAVDWWALGVLLFECLTKNDPFTDKHDPHTASAHPLALYGRIVRREYAWPKVAQLHPLAAGKSFTKLKQMVGDLLAFDPSKRLGGQPMATGCLVDDDEWVPCVASVPADVKSHPALGLVAAGPIEAVSFWSALLAGEWEAPVASPPMAIVDEGLRYPDCHPLSADMLSIYRPFCEAWAWPSKEDPDEDRLFELKPSRVTFELKPSRETSGKAQEATGDEADIAGTMVDMMGEAAALEETGDAMGRASRNGNAADHEVVQKHATAQVVLTLPTAVTHLPSKEMLAVRRARSSKESMMLVARKARASKEALKRQVHRMHDSMLDKVVGLLATTQVTADDVPSGNNESTCTSYRHLRRNDRLPPIPDREGLQTARW